MLSSSSSSTNGIHTLLLSVEHSYNNMSSRPTRSTRASTRDASTVHYDASTVISDSDIDAHSDEEFHQTTKKQKKNNRKGKSTRLNAALSNIDDVENYRENPIFESLSKDDLTSADLAQTWFDDFTSTNMNTKFSALKDFLNFILRSSGCIAQLSRHDVINTDNAKDTIDEIQSLFGRQQYHEFPMVYTKIGNNKDWKEYPTNATAFVAAIIVTSNESGALYEDDDQFLQLLLEWLGAMSTSNIRALRYTSTVFGLTIQSVLCKLSVNISTFIDKFSRQLKRENESLQTLIDSKANKRNLQRQVESISERIKVIENNVEMYKNQKQIIDGLITDFFNSIFVHRYRDVASDIRLKCVVALGEWMEDYPEMFFESSYLRYLGWLLTDQDSSIRSEVFKVLIKLYKKRITVAALRQFTSYFKQKLIEIIIYETDFSARYNCLQLVNEIVAKGYFEDDDNIKLTSLIFVDNEDIIYPTGSKLNSSKLSREIVKVIEKVETSQVSELIEADEIEYERLNTLLPFQSSQFLKIKTLLSILHDSYEYYSNNYATTDTKKNPSNSKLLKLEKVFQYIYSTKCYNNNNEMFELLITYVNLDFTAFDISDSIRETLELDTKQQTLLLTFINGVTCIYTEGESNIFHKSLFTTLRGVKTNELDNTYYISRLVTQLPGICNYFHADIEKIKILLQISIHILKFKHESKGMKETVSLFLRFCSVINFPTFTKSEFANSTYIDSINHQYIEFFKTVDIEELDLVSSINGVLTETKLNLSSQIESNEVSIHTITKLYILSHNITTTNTALNELTVGLKQYAGRFHELNSEISTFLHISNSFITTTLYRIFESRSSTANDAITAINTIQRALAVSITLDDELTLETVQEICVAYLDNVLTIHAFVAEFSNIVGVDDDIVRSLTRYVTGSTVSSIMQLWRVKEFQVAELHNTHAQIDRDVDEEVSFRAYSVVDEDVDVRMYEIALCELSAKILLVQKLELIDDVNVVKRIVRNADLLGDAFKTVLRQVDVLVNGDDEDAGVKNKNLKQKKITDLIKTRKLIDESDSDEEDDVDLLGQEDPEDPIENSDDDDNDDDRQRDEEMEFSDLDEDMSDDDGNRVVTDRNGMSTDISSFATSFPFTQEA